MISIIIPIYNGEKHIDRCLNNILSQTYQDIEIILIDDGSTDKSIKLCKKYLNSRIRLFCNTINKGSSFSRNVGIEKANGEYICFFDIDDIFYTNDSLELLYRPPFDLICGNFELIQNNSLVIDKYELCTKEIKLDREQFIQKTLDYIQYPRGTNNLYSDVWAKLHKASIIKKYNIRFHPYMTKDEVVAFSLQYARYVNSCLIIPDIVYKYTQPSTDIEYYKKYMNGKGDLVFNMVATFEQAKEFLKYTNILEDQANAILIKFMNYYLKRYLYYNKLLGYLEQ